ncbi:MAG: hypothetical protein J7623_16340 [Chitinophaga sp.]|uniref:hypothetical protein n=1 Tax=Chitinophaga sp. TaxID=1869181 RepID=UPI001B02F90B|nr:hypothetical protein [Chitinophaga sp.]MBO9730210.1 hypothetical protein [Chitinophaga sp.]
MKYFYVTACALLFVTGLMSCRKDDDLSLSPLLGTWEEVAQTGVNGTITYRPGEGFRLKMYKDYTYFMHTGGIADVTGTFKLATVDVSETATVKVIDWSSGASNSYTFIRDTLVLKPFSRYPTNIDDEIWEMKYVRRAN